MTSKLLGKAGKKVFAKHLQQYEPVDPVYEYYTDDRGRTKQRKRELPPGLSKRDAAILRSVKRRARHLDKGFSLCGFRFGWTFLISLIPVAGDAAVASLNYFLVVRKAKQADLPGWLVRRMVLNNAVSLAFSLVPLVGDVVLAVYKANSRNSALLEEYLRIRGEEFLKVGGGVVEDASGKTKKKKGISSKPPLPAHDVAEVKPGAGMTGSEMKSAVDPHTVTDPTMASISTSPLLEEPRAQSSSFGFFGRSRKATSTSPTSSGGNGRFVENVGR